MAEKLCPKCGKNIPENIREHFKGIWNYEPIYMKLGNQERVYKKDIFSKYGIEV